FLINIFEMLSALLFQTLPAEALDKYVEPSILRTPGEKGLNIALPISQGRTQKKAPLKQAVVPSSSQDDKPEADLDIQELTEKDFTDEY
ncbi:MAG: hypothetical protein Q9183_006505, partial [Haloplaca sp. 2 TL-2023]